MESRELAGLRVAIYARYSSDMQRAASIDDQVYRCRAYVEAHGGTVRDDLVFADHAISGASMDRPRFVKLSTLATSTPAKVDVIVVEDLSRVGRDQADLHLLRRALEYSKVRLVGIADGIDTAAANGKAAFALKGIMSEMYVDDLRDRAKRGLDGRARAGFATGGVGIGFRLVKELGVDGKPCGSRPTIDEDGATTVRRIFALYLDGLSLAGVAKRLNDEGVTPPRVHASRRRVGWKDSTIRAILRNESYVGRWRYKQTQWRKLPGTNVRRPSKCDPSQVMILERPALRIVDAETWTAVQSRLAAVAAHYTKTADGKAKGRSVPGAASSYLFSGLLHCAACGGRMVISGGSSDVYYRCEGHSKRGICENALSVRESVVRSNLLDEIRHRLTVDEGVAHARKRIAEKLGEMARERDGDLRAKRTQLAKLDEQIARLVDFIADGNGSKAVAERLKPLEREADALRREVAAIERRSVEPIALPSVDDMLRRVFDLEARLTADTTKGRELLRSLFRDGRIDLIAQPGRFYVAKSELLPLVVLMEPPSEVSPGGRYTPSSCAGWN